MKKIGVITFSDTTHNYGQILQCFAMQQTLKRLGFNPFLIRFNTATKSSYKNLCLKSKFIKFISSLSYYIHKLSSKEQISLTPKIKEPDRHFEQFIKKYINTTYYKTVNEIYSNPPIADAIICGSDQIWGTSSPLYYLDFIKDKRTKKIAYAPSFGGAKLNILDFLKIRLLIKDFKHISVREEDGINVCKRCGRNDAIVVPDPTLILPINEYKKIISKKLVPQNDYVFVYMLKNKTNFDIFNFEKEANQKGFQVIYVTANGLEDNHSKIYPTIEEWLGLIENASYVVTNSFHCSVFSILFNKNFKINRLIGQCEKMNMRFDNLIKHYNLNFSTSVFDTRINYSKINQTIMEDSEKYAKMLYSWLAQ